MAVAPELNNTPTLRRAITSATARVRLLRARHQGANGLIIGSAISGAVLLAMRLRLLEGDTFAEEWLIAPPVAGLLLGALWGATRAVPPLAVLRFLEEKLDLKERLSTAHALGLGTATNVDSDFAARVQADAEAFTPQGDSLKKALPFFPIPRRVYAALTAALATFLLWFLPTLPLFQSAATRAENASLKREGERLVKIAKALEKDANAKKLDKARDAAKKLQALGQEMQKGRMTHQKALMKAAKLTDEMKKAQEQAAQQSGQKSLPSAARELDKALKSMDAAGKMGQNAPGKDGAKLNPPDGSGPKDQPNSGKDGKNGKDGKPSASQDAMKKSQQAMAQNDTPSLAEQLSKLADAAQKGEPGDKAGQEKLANQLEALSKALKGTSLDKASQPLKEAAEAMKQGDMQKAAEKLREAARKVAEAAKQGEESDAMEKMAAALAEGQGGESSENPDMSDGGEGQGEGDAFGKDGKKKGQGEHVHTAQCLSPGGQCNGNGKGKNGGNDAKGKGKNGIGSGAGKLGGERPEVTDGGAYLDANSAPDGNKFLNRATQEANVRDDQFNRLYAPDGKMNNTRVTGKRGDKGKETVQFIKGAPDKADAKVPYYEVFGNYAPAAESAMNREDIPSNYKKQVKDYFDAIRPGSKSSTGNGAKPGGK